MHNFWHSLDSEIKMFSLRILIFGQKSCFPKVLLRIMRNENWRLPKGQIKPKAGLACHRISQRICFVCCEKQKKQTKQICLFVFGENQRQANCFRFYLTCLWVKKSDNYNFKKALVQLCTGNFPTALFLETMSWHFQRFCRNRAEHRVVT